MHLFSQVMQIYVLISLTGYSHDNKLLHNVCNSNCSILSCYLWKEEVNSTMSKRQKKKARVVEEVPQAEAETKTEYIYGDTQCVSGVKPEYQWGDVYRLITRREVPDMGLEEEPIYANIERSALMKVATRPELFP